MKEIQGPVGRLEARLDRPAGAARAVVVVASPHPKHGGTMQDKVVYQATQGFVRAGCAVLRFNYRGAGTSDGEFSDGPGEMDDYRAALDAAAREFPGLPIWAAGYSFGAYIAMTAGAADPRVTQLVGIGDGHRRQVRLRRGARDGEAEVPAARRARRAQYGEIDPQVLRRADGAARAGRHRRRGSLFRWPRERSGRRDRGFAGEG